MKFDNILINGPKEAKNLLLFAHGAGASMDSNFIKDGNYCFINIDVFWAIAC